MFTKCDEWWTNLTVQQKERIATKAKSLESNGQSKEIVHYPACSAWWNTLAEEKKQQIHDHCTDQHGYLLKEWSEGRSLSY